MVVFTFKIAYTEDKISYDIPNSWNTKYAFLRIRDYIVDDFNLNNCFEFVYVNGIPLSYNGVMEEYDVMDLTLLNNTSSLCDNFREDHIHTFYIRFIEESDYEDVNGRIVVIT
jgi:hypothetical protein